MTTPQLAVAPLRSVTSCSPASPVSLATDVKPSNVLINTQGQVKMCDFGISGYLVDSVAKTMDAGCKPYMAVTKRFIQGAVDELHCGQRDARGQQTHSLPFRDS